MSRPSGPPGDDNERLRKHKDRAVELTAKGRLDGALAEYAEALRLAPGDVVSRQRAAELLARLGRTAEAIEHYLCLVGKYATEGHFLKAIATCHLILSLDPSHRATVATLCDLYAARDAPRGPVRIPSLMCPAILPRPSAPPPVIDPETLARAPLFSDLAADAFVALLRDLRRRDVAAGETIVEEGAPGDAMFAIAHGAVQVERRAPNAPPRVVAELGEGELFGEMSLVASCPRLATVSAKTDSVLLELPKARLERTVAEHPRVGEVLRRFYKERLLANVLRASAVFRELPRDRHAALAEVFKIDAHPPQRTLLEQGAPPAGFFLLLRGVCDVVHVGKGGGEEAYPAMVEGDVFGEVSLLQGGAITATVRTRTPCTVLSLPREWFDELLLAHPEVRAANYEIAARRLERTRELVAKEVLRLV